MTTHRNACGCSSTSWLPRYTPSHSDKLGKVLQQDKGSGRRRAGGARREQRARAVRARFCEGSVAQHGGSGAGGEQKKQKRAHLDVGEKSAEWLALGERRAAAACLDVPQPGGVAKHLGRIRLCC